MNIGIVGPSKIDTFCSITGIDRHAFERSIKRVASHIAKTENHIIVVPDKDSTAELFAKTYRENGGKKAMGVIPTEDREFGNKWLNPAVCNEILDCKTWRNEPMEFAKKSDVMICFGLGLGTMIEISYTRWYPTNKIYMVKEFVPRLPLEISSKLHVLYVSTEELLNSIPEF